MIGAFHRSTASLPELRGRLRSSRTRRDWLRRLFASVVLAAVLWQQVGASASYGLAAESAPRVPPAPLVILAEPGGGDGVPEAFLSACEKQGYVRGESLAEMSVDLFSDLGEGAEQVARLVNACVERSPSGRVDVIACGVSGLVARLAIDGGMIPSPSVGTLVMVASPNRGSFLACVLKSIVEVARHESLFEKESRSWRYLPLGEGILSLFSPGSAEEPPDYSSFAHPRDQEWSDETAWIARRVREVYEPLYAKYVTARFSAIPYVPAQSPKETFAGWICRTMPQFWQSAVMKSTLPPDGSPAYPAGLASVSNSVPPPGKDLSAAYYELLAMEVAKNQYVMRQASKGNVVESLVKEPYVPSGWKDALLHYGVRVLQYYAGKALLTVKAELQNALANVLVRRTGFIEDSASPLLRRLVKEDLVVNLGTSSAKRFERVTANTYLGALNAASLELSSERSTRYVSIAAKLASPWNLIWPQLGPNDFLLEVDSAIAPSGPRDCHRVFTGLFSPSGAALLQERDAQSYLFALLGADAAGPGGAASAAAHSPDGFDGGRVRASSWGPSYVSVGETGGVATITLPDPPAGWQFQAWTEGHDGGTSPCTSLRYMPSGGTYTMDVSPGLLGLRLARSGPQNPISGRSVTSAFLSEVRADAGVGVGGEAPGQSAGQPPPGAPVSIHPPAEPRGAEAGVEAIDPSLSGYPLIRVINRSKRTTHEEPKETYHGSWVIDCGDGHVQTVDGNPEMTFSHVFPREGAYRVHAQSYDNRGDPLLEHVWNVAVGGDDLEKTFTCRSIPRLSASLEINGPAMWVTGKPAVYSAELKMDPEAGIEVVSVEYDPGPRFCVLWERSGDFQVSCAAKVRLRYFIAGETLTVTNTYVTEITVEVLTTGVTR
ncbi:MAG: hypothetical protein ACM3WU_05705 [Bacillota bacterium]